MKNKNKTYRSRIKILFVVLLLAAIAAGEVQSEVHARSKPALSRTSVTIKKNKSVKLSLKNISAKKVKKTIYKSSKKSVAKVNKKGKVTGVKPGKATITCKVTLKSGKKYSLKCKVTVKKTSPSQGLKTKSYKLNGVPFKMIFVKGGTFTMGSDQRAKGSGTQVSNQAGEHQVTLSSYLIGETEVTRALWNEVMNGSHSDSDLNYPIASVTVPQCRTFVEKLNEKAHAAGIISDSQNFHMLTEAQWEFAAKGGNKSKGYTYAGSNTLSEVAWTSDDGDYVHKVKQKKSNELGIYDMSGNVYEWVADYAAPYSTEAQTNPCNTTPSSNYIKRGGSFYYNDAYRFTSTYRYFYSATDYTIGVRIGLY